MEPKIFTLFKNSYIHIISKSLRATQSKNTGHIVIDGFLNDFCDTYFYLSAEPMGEVTIAIRREDVTQMSLPIDELMGILEANNGGNNEEMM